MNFLFWVLLLSVFFASGVVFLACDDDDDEDDDEDNDQTDDDSADDDSADDDSADDDDDSSAKDDCVEFYMDCGGLDEATAETACSWADTYADANACIATALENYFSCLNDDVDCADYANQTAEMTACFDAFTTEIGGCV